MERHEVFRKNYLVHGLKDEVIDEIEGLAKQETFLAREFLVKRGEKSSDLYVILEGTVLVCTPAGDELAQIGPGSVLGEIALVDDQPRSADAVCKGLVKVAKFPAKDLRSFMAKNTDAGFLMLANLSRVLSNRLRKTDAVVENLAVHPKDPWKNAL
ncbi:MAG: Crp/Fnr family transcriptional regulator [Fimbriimonadales bacterium]